MRLGELLCLTHADWHVVGGHTVCGGGAEGPSPRPAVKGGRHRRIYVSDALERLYSDYMWLLADAAEEAGRVLDDSWFVFVNLTREPASPDAARERLCHGATPSPTAGDAVPKGWSPHWTRHTHATALLLAGVPEHVVSGGSGMPMCRHDEPLWLVTEDAEMRAAAEWRRFAEGWRLGDD